jgi:hypothetical protein
VTRGDLEPERTTRGRVALILAASLGSFLLLFTLFAVLEAWSAEDRSLSENATQLLSTAVGGIIGVLAGYVGGVEAGKRAADPPPADPPALEWHDADE